MHQSIPAVPDYSEYCTPLSPITITNKKKHTCLLYTSDAADE